MTALAAPRVPAQQSAESPGEKHGSTSAWPPGTPTTRHDLVTAAEATSAVHGAAAASAPAGICHPPCTAAPRKGRAPGTQHPRLGTHQPALRPARVFPPRPSHASPSSHTLALVHRCISPTCPGHPTVTPASGHGRPQHAWSLLALLFLGLVRQGRG